MFFPLFCLFFYTSIWFNSLGLGTVISSRNLLFVGWVYIRTWPSSFLHLFGQTYDIISSRIFGVTPFIKGAPATKPPKKQPDQIWKKKHNCQTFSLGYHCCFHHSFLVYCSNAELCNKKYLGNAQKMNINVWTAVFLIFFSSFFWSGIVSSFLSL